MSFNIYSVTRENSGHEPSYDHDVLDEFKFPAVDLLVKEPARPLILRFCSWLVTLALREIWLNKVKGHTTIINKRQ